MEELTRISATEIAACIKRRAVSPVEIVEAYLRRIEDVNPSLNAVVTLAPDALEKAQDAENTLMRGLPVGPLYGVPVTIKDTFEVAGLRSTSGSLVRAHHVPEKDATAVARLRAAGAIILGKTNVPEMALTYDSENAVFGRTLNPHDAARVPGGSSGGEAAAVAACLSAAGLGSDLVGSIRIPAHFCGVLGLKPTSGLVPGEGHCPSMTGRLREAAAFGPLARSVHDLALLFDVLTDARHRGSDGSNNVHASLRKKAAELKGVRVAYYVDDLSAPVTDETKRAVERAAQALRRAGLEVREARPPNVERGAALWLKRFSPDVGYVIKRVYSTQDELERAGPAARALLARAAQRRAPSEAELLHVDEECARLREALLEWMSDTPLLLAPVGSVPAFAHGARKVTVGDKELNVFDAFSYAQTFNTFNLPTVSVPAARSGEGLPIGVQLVGRPFAEETVLAAALIVEEALGGWLPPPVALPPTGHNPL